MRKVISCRLDILCVSSLQRKSREKIFTLTASEPKLFHWSVWVKLTHKRKMMEQIYSYDSSEYFCEFNEPEIAEIDGLHLLLAVNTACC